MFRASYINIVQCFVHFVSCGPPLVFGLLKTKLDVPPNNNTTKECTVLFLWFSSTIYLSRCRHLKIIK